MASLTITELDEGLERRLRARAAANGRSLEDEARRILADALPPPARSAPHGNVAEAIAAIVDPIGGFDLDIPPRS